MKRETAEVEPSKLDESSRRVLAALDDHPIRPRANLLMEQRSDGSWRLVATIPSPTGIAGGIWGFGSMTNTVRPSNSVDGTPTRTFGTSIPPSDCVGYSTISSASRMERSSSPKRRRSATECPFVSSMSATAKRFSMS
jgi:hypothetical protein